MTSKGPHEKISEFGVKEVIVVLSIVLILTFSLILWISHFRLYCPPIFRLILHYAFELFVALRYVYKVYQCAI